MLQYSLTALLGFNLSALKADGTTIRFTLSYGAGTPSNTFRRSNASFPLFVLCGSIPLIKK